MRRRRRVSRRRSRRSRGRATERQTTNVARNTPAPIAAQSAPIRARSDLRREGERRLSGRDIALLPPTRTAKGVQNGRVPAPPANGEKATRKSAARCRAAREKKRAAIIGNGYGGINGRRNYRRHKPC